MKFSKNTKIKSSNQYDLKQFMADGYSKKVMLLEENQNDSDKMLDAILLSVSQADCCG